MQRSGVLAVDVGGTSVKAAVVDADGRVVFDHRIATPNDPSESVPAIVAAATVADTAARARGIHPVGLGVVVPGQVDTVAGIAVYAANLGWRDVPLRSLLQERVSMPVALGHDVTCGGLAELAFGGRRNQNDHNDQSDQDVVVVQIGTGIAATIRSGGSIVRGTTGVAGEVGHIPIVPNGEQCPCGQRGCLERYSSASSITRRYREAGGHANLTTEQLAGRLDRDPLAARIWAEAVETLAAAVATLTMLLDPEAIVLSGGLSEAGAILLDPLVEAVGHTVVWRPPPLLLISRIGAQVGLAGAALLAWQSAGRGDEARWVS